MDKQHRRLFLERYESIKETSCSHPYAKWMAVIDPSADPACCALDGKVWKVNGNALYGTVFEHIYADLKNCRCRLTPLRHSGNAEDELACRAKQLAKPPLVLSKKERKRRLAGRAVALRSVVESVAISNARIASSLKTKADWLDRLKRFFGLRRK